MTALPLAGAGLERPNRKLNIPTNADPKTTKMAPRPTMDASSEQLRSYNELLHLTTSRANTIKMLRAFLLALVLHALDHSIR
jgi:hypothetical protein